VGGWLEHSSLALPKVSMFKTACLQDFSETPRLPSWDYYVSDSSELGKMTAVDIEEWELLPVPVGSLTTALQHGHWLRNLLY